MLFMPVQIQADVQVNQNDVDSDVSNASPNLSTTGFEGIFGVGFSASGWKLVLCNINFAN
jgi:hypothetical protein